MRWSVKQRHTLTISRFQPTSRIAMVFDVIEGRHTPRFPIRPNGKINRALGFFIIGAFLTLTCQSFAQGNLVVNGGFFSENGSQISGWTYHGGYVYAPGSLLGDRGVDGPEYIGIGGDFSQVLRTEPGQTYELTFSRRTNPSIVQEGPNAIRVQWGQQDLGTFAISQPSFWTTERLIVTADSSDTLLRFSKAYPSIPFMDGVSVVAIPEPSTIALIFVGLAACLLRQNARRAILITRTPA